MTDKLQIDLNKLLYSSNSNTRQLETIHKSDELIKQQFESLNRCKSLNNKLFNKYLKLWDKTDKFQNQIDIDNFSNLQHFAELCDQQLRILENTIKIIENNQQYK
ncbi:hypothetical protein WICMUC_004987 [Wickerhamomyces mucosus]|uniref:Uncharacterized protein n=1 Tax=Wickerhamomyces mucosus TaxID=1378264 RepID=A0A9P8PBG6_9ASCO|nr:hypothetical protein WICMUC_004987 [Wickerhamomyces mucosus]